MRTPTERGALDARVASQGQRADLDRQRGRLVAGAAAHDFAVAQAGAEVGAGRSGARPKLRRLGADRTVGTVVVEPRDRLARRGSGYLEAARIGAGRRLIGVDAEAGADDRVQDRTEGLTSRGARRDGRRSARTRANRVRRGAAQPVEAR